VKSKLKINSNSKKFIRKWHILLGTALYLPFLVIAISGILLGFYDLFQEKFSYFQIPLKSSQTEFRQSLSRSQMLVENSIKNLKEQLKRGHIESIYPSQSERQALRMQLIESKNHHKFNVFLDPGSGEILGEQEQGVSPWISWLFKIHRGDWGGFPGRVFASTCGILVSTMWLTGLIMRRRRKEKKSRVFRLLDYHQALGTFCGGVIMVMTASGALINFKTDLIQWLDPPPRSKKQMDKKLDGLESIEALDAKIQLARSKVPDYPLTKIEQEKGQASILVFTFRDKSRIYINAGSNQIEKEMTPSTKWIHALYPFHSGRIFGWWHVIFALVMGSALLLIFTSGLLLPSSRDSLKKLRSNLFGQNPRRKLT